MPRFSRLLAGFSALTTAFAAPAMTPTDEIQERGPFNFVLGPDSGNPDFRRSNMTMARRSNTNFNQDYITGSTVNYSPGTNQFSVTWNTQADFVVGVGWNPGSNAPITYSGTFSVSSGLGSLSLYGWSTNPLVEYYVMEDNVGISMSTATNKGTVTTDGGTYTIYEATRVNAPSIQGTSTFNQYISVRQSPRTSGTVTIANHFNAWASHGMTLGTLNYQVIAVESWSGSGSASQTVSNTGSSGGSGGSGGGSSTCAALYGQCGGTGWTGATCCASGTCKYSNAYYSQCL